MTLRVAPLLSLLILAANVGCRDAASSPAQPNFGLAAADTIPGGCDRQVCHFRSTGASAFVSWVESSSPTPGDTGGGGGEVVRFGSLSVSTSGPHDGAQTFLSYDVTECGVFCFSVASGFGTIPNQDFSGKASSAGVNTNTSGNPNFFTFAGPAGLITVEWVGNRLFETENDGRFELKTPDFRQRQDGRFSSSSADATGTVVGLTIAVGNQGSISSNRDVRITISHR